MDIHAWDPSRHLPVVDSWIEDRGLRAAKGRADLLPPTGFVVDDTVAGFLYRTDAPSVAYFDSFVGNPQKSRGDVALAMTALVGRLMDAAREQGVKVLCAHTGARSILDAFRANGWFVEPTAKASFASVALEGTVL